MHVNRGCFFKIQGGKIYIDKITRLFEQPEEKYFDYFISNIVDYIAPLRASAVP
jgi:hypothetical protein